VTLIRETTADVEQIRGIRRKQNLKVQILDDKLFSAAVREKAKKELTPEVVAAERARWLAFNLAPAAADPAQVLLDVLDEQVAGFYDPFTKQLYVRKDPPASAAGAMGPDGLRLILAHEIEHALQDQNFGIPDLAALPDDDVRLARSALYEGDAMAVMSAYGALRARKPVKAAIVGFAHDGDRVLEVIEYPEAPGRAGREDASVVDHGLTHVGLLCDDIDATRARLEQHGVEFLTSGVAGLVGLRTTWFTDPYGVVFILVEKRRPDRPYYRQVTAPGE